MLRVLQKIRGYWQEFRGLVLEHSAGAPPEGIGEGGVYYDSTSKAPMYYDGTTAKPMAGTPDHEELLNLQGGETGFHGHNTQVMQDRQEAAGAAGGYAVYDSQGVIPLERLPVGLLGGLNPKGAWNPATNTPALANPAQATTRGWFYIASGTGTQLGTDWASGDWCVSDGAGWQKIDNSDRVASVHGRLGAVVAQAGDYNASQITFTPVGGVGAVTAQAAIVELASEKLAAATAATTYATIASLGSHTGASSGAHAASAISCTATGDVGATNVQAAIAELASEKQANIAAGTTAQYYRGDKTWQDLPSAVRAVVLTGLSTATNVAIAVTDSVLAALGKLQAQITANLSTLTSHTGNTSNPHSVTKAQVGLGNVDNTSDVNKPVSTATSSAISTASTADRNRANHTGTQAAGTISDFASTVRSTVLTGLASGANAAIAATDTLLGGLAKLQAQITANLSTLTSHTGNTSNPHSVTKAQVGLGNVDNTSDVNKPVSTAMANALLGKIDKVAVGGVHNYPGVGESRWRGLAVIDAKSQWNGGTAHVVMTSRFNHCDIYLTFEGNGTVVGTGAFTVLWDGWYKPEIKVVVSGYKAYLYSKDYGAYNQVSIMSMGLNNNSAATIAVHDYNSATDPGAGMFPRYCQYNKLQHVDGLTSDAQTQITAAQSTADTKLARDGSQNMTGDLIFSGVSGTNKRFIQLGMGANDFGRITAGATADNAGYLEIATADDGAEPIYLRQYSGTFATLVRSATLLDASGNTSFPGTVTAPAFNGLASKASMLFENSANTNRNIDDLKAPAGGYAAYVVNTPLSTAGLPMSTSWAFVTEQVHTDTGYALQTFTDYWTNRQFIRRKESGNWKPWSELATTSGNVATATALTTSAGDANTPVYFTGGKPVACTSLSLSTSGNAATASKLATTRTIALSGAVTGSGSFDGSGNLTIAAAVTNNSHSHVVGDVGGLEAHLNARARTFSYKASSIDGTNLWTLIASFSPSAKTTYNFGISLSMAGSDFPWTNAPFDLYVTYRDGSFDVRGYFTTDRAAGDIYYGVVGGVVKVFLRNWSNWATAYGGTILFDSHGVVNFASSTTTTPTGMTVYTPLERPGDYRIVSRPYVSGQAHDAGTIYLEY